ncbi:MAG: CDP-archaeol synthase [Gemmatimonadales bacterium]|nr:CDP-archaeol synthase [Gemmatimonadales bacterium]
MDRNFVQRVSVVAVAVPVSVFVVYQGGMVLALALAAVGALGAREVFDLARKGGVDAAWGLGLIGAAAPALVTYTVLTGGDLGEAAARGWIALAAAWLLVLLTWVLGTRRPDQKPLSAIATTLFGVVYAGALPAFLLAIRHPHEGPRSWAGVALVFFPLVVVWVCDTAAMFAGRAIGGPKLAPTVSPGKTRSGAMAGVIGAVAASLLYVAVVLEPSGFRVPVWQGVIFGLLLGVVGQVGDLVESLMKREAGVKDSSTLIPGHGGMLDRLDSLYFALPAATILYLAFGIV